MDKWIRLTPTGQEKDGQVAFYGYDVDATRPHRIAVARLGVLPGQDDIVNLTGTEILNLTLRVPAIKTLMERLAEFT